MEYFFTWKSRRIADPVTLDTELTAWQQQRNLEQAYVVWRFTTQDTRVKLRSLYPNQAN
ncbi:MAG: hypothetical protein RMX65_016690 [Nostoc sp. DedQUE01]|nr:hypothetical protein [Nostoc sp. DedQUE01]